MVRLEEIKVGAFTFDCRDSGDKTNDLVIFLHGFPETSYMWNTLLPEISKLGFYCLAPNLRGYSKGARPRGKKHYTIEKLSEDVLGLAKAVGSSKFHLIGHDWGAAIGWNTVFQHQDAIKSFTSLSVPHIEAFDKARFNNEDQKRKSRYMTNFQLPFLPEYNLKKDNFKMLRKIWRESSDSEIKDYRGVFSQKYTATAAINYYRANKKMTATNSKQLTVKVPTLFIWGEKDRFIGAAGVKTSHDYIKGYYKFVNLDAGHWLIQTKFKEIKKEISEHLAKFK